METFSDRVEAMELEVGGPANLARAAGVTSAAVAQWKSGGKPDQLKAAPLLKLQRATGIRPEWVVFGRGPMKSDAAVRDDLVEQLSSAVAVLSTDERAVLGETLAKWIRTADPADKMASAIRAFIQPAPGFVAPVEPTAKRRAA